MSTNVEETSGDDGSARFFTVQPLRDPESNWAVDLAKNLEEYLLKICSGEITNEDGSYLSVNFAEAALLLQGSVQVYGRKVEYLYTLVLHALESITKQRQQDQEEGTSNQSDEQHPHRVAVEENDTFWCPDDVPVDEKNCLDMTSSTDVPLNQSLKPPANLVVLEGDCLDTVGDGGELESYLLATSNVYRDFILLDPCDAPSVDDFLLVDKSGMGDSTYRNKTLSVNSQRSFLSPRRRSGGSAYKSPLRKGQDVNHNQTLLVGHDFEFNDHNVGLDPHSCAFSGDHFGSNVADGYSEPVDSDDSIEGDDDPWKPLNPHEPGNLKVRPFKKVQDFRRHGVTFSKGNPLSKEFPLAKLDGPISLDLKEIWRSQYGAPRQQEAPGSPPLYEKLRKTLVTERCDTGDVFGDIEDDHENGFDGDTSDIGQTDIDFQEGLHMDENAPFPNDKHDNDFVNFDSNAGGHEEVPDARKSLEDLCRSHLDALLASIAENEKQTELATRVSTWKQKIEHNLEEQDSRPPFDIHEYGSRILDKLVSNTSGSSAMSFWDIVSGLEKHDVARSFSALLQLVNNGSVGLDKPGADSGEPICYTAENPFHVCLLHGNEQQGAQPQPSKKRAKSPTPSEGDRAKPQGLLHGSSALGMVAPRSHRKYTMKLKKAAGRCTPEGKKRPRSQLVEAVDLHSPV